MVTRKHFDPSTNAAAPVALGGFLESIPGLYADRIRAIEVYTQGTHPAPFDRRACSVLAIWTVEGFGE